MRYYTTPSTSSPADATSSISIATTTTIITLHSGLTSFSDIDSDQEDWLDDTIEEPDEQQLEAHYMYMAKIQEVDSNVIPDSSDMCKNGGQDEQNA
ncbi:hypothetical protein Tco_0505865 [Tanacetum coccineum]